MNTATPQANKGAEAEGTADAMREGGASAMDAAQDLRAEQRADMISQAAYYRAQHRDFEEGSELEDWLQAEAEIERMLGPR